MKTRSIAGTAVIGLLALLAVAAIISLWGTNRGAVRVLEEHITRPIHVAVKAMLGAGHYCAED